MLQVCLWEVVSPNPLEEDGDIDGLRVEAELVKFSQKGTHFAVLFPRKIQIYSLVSR